MPSVLTDTSSAIANQDSDRLIEIYTDIHNRRQHFDILRGIFFGIGLSMSLSSLAVPLKNNAIDITGLIRHRLRHSVDFQTGLLCMFMSSASLFCSRNGLVSRRMKNMDVEMFGIQMEYPDTFTKPYCFYSNTPNLWHERKQETTSQPVYT